MTVRIGYVLWSDERAQRELGEHARMAEPIETAYRCWRFSGLGGDLSQELPLPRSFREASEILTREQVAENVICGNDPGQHREKIAEFVDAGFDHVYVHQVGSDQEAFMRLYEREILSVAVR